MSTEMTWNSVEVIGERWRWSIFQAEGRANAKILRPSEIALMKEQEDIQMPGAHRAGEEWSEQGMGVVEGDIDAAKIGI